MFNFPQIPKSLKYLIETKNKNVIKHKTLDTQTYITQKLHNIRVLYLFIKQIDQFFSGRKGEYFDLKKAENEDVFPQPT